MNTAVRTVSCLLAICFCTSSFAQTAPSLAQLQEKAKQQVEQTPWIKRHAVPLAAVVAAGGVLTINQLRQAHRNKVLRAQIKELEQGLQDYKYEVSRLRENNDFLSWKVEQAENRATFAEKISEKKHTLKPAVQPTPKPAPSASATPLSRAKTDLSKRLVQEQSYLLKNMPEAEVKYLLQDIDLLAKQKPSHALYTLQRMMRKSSGNIARVQALIAVEKHIKFGVVTALLAVFIEMPDVHAQNQLMRLQQNPALFLEATPQQLAAWEQNPQADALCRRTAEAIDRAASLDLSDQEARDLTRQAAQEVAAQKAELSSHLRKQLAR